MKRCAALLCLGVALSCRASLPPAGPAAIVPFTDGESGARLARSRHKNRGYLLVREGS